MGERSGPCSLVEHFLRTQTAAPTPMSHNNEAEPSRAPAKTDLERLAHLRAVLFELRHLLARINVV